MRRDLQALADRTWDVLVIGGGIHGACVVWEAALRGLTGCLVERADFGSATSANTMKIVHGGLRYLQHGDVRRMRESIGERRALLRIAPHLVHPLPVVVPTYGHGWRGREVLQAALALSDLVGADRNVGLDEGQRIPRSRTISRRECQRLVPGVQTAGLTGAAVFHDALVENSERLLLAFLHTAAKAGAEVANYAEVTALRREGPAGLQAAVTDRVTGESLLIRAGTVVNASGPWLDRVLGLADPGVRVHASFARAFNVVTRPLFPHAVALATPCTPLDPGALVSRGHRLLFVVPWRGHSLVGTGYAPHEGAAGECRVTEEDVSSLLGALNQACPTLALGLPDVRLVHGGLLPAAGVDAATGEPRLARQGQIVDHAGDGWPGLISVVGVKYTTARRLAERAVDRVLQRLGRRPAPSVSARVPLHGGDPAGAAGAPPVVALRSHGSAWGEVLAYLGPGETLGDRRAVLRAEVRHAIRAEMARSLGDIVFRRTELGSAGHPGPALLGEAARAAAVEQRWSAEQERAELAQVYGRFGIPR
jgi:glycerol-3-phosphate dehydrogenase